MKSLLPPTGTEEFLELLSPFVPHDFLNQQWPRLMTGGRRYHLSSAQLWRLHLLVLLTPVHSFNLLIRMLPEQKACRHFARLRNLAQLPDVRMMNEFRAQMGVSGFSQTNDQLLKPLLHRLDPALPAVALMDATDLPAACSGIKKALANIRLRVQLWVGAPTSADKASALSAIRSILFGFGLGAINEGCCWCPW